MAHCLDYSRRRDIFTNLSNLVAVTLYIATSKESIQEDCIIFLNLNDDNDDDDRTFLRWPEIYPAFKCWGARDETQQSLLGAFLDDEANTEQV